MKPLIIFDVAETILDLAGLAPAIRSILGDREMLRAWFHEFIIYAEAVTLTDHYADAGAVGAAVLKMLAHAQGVTPNAGQLEAFKAASATMPAYRDVPPGLTRLRAAGFRLATLSNSPTVACEAQLKAAGIRDFFERVFSVDDDVKRYKPARETYLTVATALGAQPADLCLVSCHAFDIMGAATAGLQAAMLLRPGNAPFELGPQPQMVAADLDALSHMLVARFGDA